VPGLIATGTLVRDAGDVLAQLGLTPAVRRPEAAPAGDPADARILRLLDAGPPTPMRSWPRAICPRAGAGARGGLARRRDDRRRLGRAFPAVVRLTLPNAGRDAPAPHRVGKLREPYLVAAAEDFRRRLRPYHRLEESRCGRRRQRGRARDAGEAEAILRLIAPSDHVWLLERTGTEISSEELAARIERLPLDGISQLTLVIAGTYGAAPALLERAQFRWSLSRLTLLHEWRARSCWSTLSRGEDRCE